MPKFAVYVVPPAGTDLYRRGTEILGYDLRSGDLLPADNPTRRLLPAFDPTWVQRPQSYGFHMTTGYTLFYDAPQTLAQVEAEMAALLSCFGRATAFWLTPDPDDFIPFWGGQIVVLRYQPNPALLMLHTLLVARINPLGRASSLSARYAANPNAYDPVDAARVRQYHTPYILDGWSPHFTLMQPYTGSDRAAMRRTLGALFPAEPLRVESIVLLTLADGDSHYRLHREFHFHDYPPRL